VSWSAAAFSPASDIARDDGGDDDDDDDARAGRSGRGFQNVAR
jgi:hypothetical protein